MIGAALLAALASPTSAGWQIERKAERCEATHRFDGKTPGVFKILSRTSTDFDAVVNIEMPGAPPEWQMFYPKLRLSRDSRIASRFGRISLSPTGGIVVGMPLDKIETADLASSKQVVLEVGDVATVTLNAGPLGAVMSDLQRCGDDILRGWGVDPARIVKSPPGGITAWFRGDDYPADAKRAGSQGRVMFVATLLPDGAVATCKIVTSSGSDSLDARTCELVLRRGRYDASSEGAPRWAIGVVRWAL